MSFGTDLQKDSLEFNTYIVSGAIESGTEEIDDGYITYVIYDEKVVVPDKKTEFYYDENGNMVFIIDESPEKQVKQEENIISTKTSNEVIVTELNEKYIIKTTKQKKSPSSSTSQSQPTQEETISTSQYEPQSSTPLAKQSTQGVIIPMAPFIGEASISNDYLRADADVFQSGVMNYIGPQMPLIDAHYGVYSDDAGIIESIDYNLGSDMYVYRPMDGIVQSTGGYDYGIAQKDFVRVKKEVIVEPGDVHHTELRYTVSNRNSAWKENHSLLSGLTLDEYAKPVFADLDNDNDLDLIVGGYTWLGGFDESLRYFQNTGSSTNPSWTEDASMFTGFPLVYQHPELVDLDNDNDYDLVLGLGNGTLVYYENTGSVSVPAWTLNNTMFLNIDIGSSAYPTFGDMDNDGDYDLLVGSSTLSLSYFENIGTSSYANWSYDNTKFKFTGLSDAKPKLADIDNDNDLDLVVFGNESIRYFENIGDLNDATWQTGDYLIYDTNPLITTADINGDNTQDLIFGETTLSDSHGLRVYVQDRNPQTIENAKFFVTAECASYTNSTAWYNPIQDSVVCTDNNQPGVSGIFADYTSNAHGIDDYLNEFDVDWDDGELNNVNYLNMETRPDEEVGIGLQFNLGDLEVEEKKTITLTIYIGDYDFSGIQYPDLFIEDDNLHIKSDGVSGFISNTGSRAVNNVKLTLYELQAGNIVEIKTAYIESVAENSDQYFSVDMDIDVGNTVNIVIDSDDDIQEIDESNNFVSKTYYDSNVYIVADEYPSNLNGILENYTASQLQHYNIVNNIVDANYIIHIGKPPSSLNKYSLDNLGWGKHLGYVKHYDTYGFRPYNALINSFNESGKLHIFVYGTSIDGTISALRQMNKANLDSNRDKFISDYNKDALAVHSYLYSPTNKPSYLTTNPQFETIVHKALYGEKYTVEDKTVRALDNTELRLKHIQSENTQILNDYFGYPEIPVILARGLWSNLTSWEVFGKELADDGRDVWLIEITGGPNQDCNACPDYTFDDLTDEYWPALVAGVLEYTGKSQAQYVGFSNGARTALSSLDKWNTVGLNPAGSYFDGGWQQSTLPSNPVETLVLAGVPGAFSAPTPFGECMKLFGQEIYDELPVSHVSDGELGLRIKQKNSGLSHPVCEIIGAQLIGENKISKELTYQYFKWINNTDDSQPGIGLNIDNLGVMYGFQDMLLSTDSDIVVPVADENAIYNNINALNKSIDSVYKKHNTMPEDEKVKGFIKGVINK